MILWVSKASTMTTILKEAEGSMKRKHILFAAIAVIAALGVVFMIISNNRGYSEAELRELYWRQNYAFLSLV